METSEASGNKNEVNGKDSEANGREKKVASYDLVGRGYLAD